MNADIVEKFLDNSLRLLVVLVFVIYVLSISIKRRKILQAFSRAKGYLLFGEIYNNTLSSILERVDDGSNEWRRCNSFSTAVQIIDEAVAIERRKRTQTIYWLLAGLVISYGRFVGFIKQEFPHIESLFPILEIFGPAGRILS